MDQQAEHDTYKDLGYNAKAPNGYKKIRVHVVWDVKHNRRHKARLVADGNLIEVPLSSVCSRVVSLRGVRLALFLSELDF